MTGSRRAVLSILLLLVPVALIHSAPARATAPTTVSITFDDAQATQYLARSALRDRGARATFYINSGLVGSGSYYMTWTQLNDLVADGHEPGGHTRTHVDLTRESSSSATSQVCDDRTALQARFGTVTSFAYPYAASNSSVEQIVESCGYSSGRSVGSISGPDCGGCPYAETIPPKNAYFLRTPDAADNRSTLTSLQTAVTNAENNGGGWVILVFHGICQTTTCSSSNDVPLSTFTAFLDWLVPRSATGTTIRTVGAVVAGGDGGGGGGGGAVSPSTTMSCNGTACGTGWYRAPLRVTLTATPAGSTTRYTTDGTAPSATTGTVYSGPFDISRGGSTTVRYASTDATGTLTETPRSTTVQVDADAPTAQLTSPASGTSYPKRTSKVSLSATATDPTSGISRVEFYDGSTLIGSDLTAPYEATWNLRSSKTGSGQHSLTAVAFDGAGTRTTSAPVTVTIE